MSVQESEIGVVFTPLKWAQFAIEQFDIFDRWIKGESVFDPTMGDGSLLFSLAIMAREKGLSTKEIPFQRLFGNEIQPQYHQGAIERFRDEFDLDMSNQFTCGDILDYPNNSFDVIFGNPPWINFVDLPEEQKPKYKDAFSELGLSGSNQRVLLGNSRIDLSALVIQKVMMNHLNSTGSGIFFAPLSLLLNDGAHAKFREFNTFSPVRVIDFAKTLVFDGINTRHGIICFEHGKARYPVHFDIHENGAITNNLARPLIDSTDPWTITENETSWEFPEIVIDKSSKPRQGINTGGANGVFFFSEYPNDLPEEFVHPLLTKQNFEGDETPRKWVLLPYHNSGKILGWDEICEYKTLKKYLIEHKAKLSNRKGTMLRSVIDRGYWWTLLGVGPYNFSQHKLVWEAYGRDQFKPKIFESKWQVNQSLQAYMPFDNKKSAKQVEALLKKPVIERYLRSMKMEGTMNWAQPGKIYKLLTIK